MAAARLLENLQRTGNGQRGKNLGECLSMEKSDIQLARIERDAFSRQHPVSIQDNNLSPYFVYRVLKEASGAPNGEPDPPRSSGVMN